MNKPFTGFMIHGYFENGQISGETEFVMLEDFLKLQGKKVKIVVLSDETIKGTEDLKIALKFKKKK